MVLDKGLEDKALKSMQQDLTAIMRGFTDFHTGSQSLRGHLLSEIRTMRCSSVAGAADSD